MKIVICGKGGCGKSTICALLAKEIGRRDNKVIVIDTDESNTGLHHLLGIDKPDDFMNYFGGKKLLFEKTKTIKNKWKTRDLPNDYVSGKDNIRLISMGKIHEFGEGCACPINVLSSTFLEVLELRDDEILIADTDAGIEHLGRGLERGSDMILAIIDPSRESILMAGKISRLANQAGKPVHYILNKVNEETEDVLSCALGKEDIMAVVPENKDIFMAGLKGEELNVRIEGVEMLADKVLTKRQ